MFYGQKTEKRAKKLVKTQVLAGSRSIGGNFVRIQDEDRILIFDQGIRFDLMSSYYSSFVTPRGTAELREIGILPKAEWYEDANSIYISHMHLDHLGALSNIPGEMKSHLPSMRIYKDMEEKWRTSPTWLSLVPRKYYVDIEELNPLEVDENDVMAIPVSHSASPAYSLLYSGKKKTILYTGDFRLQGYLTQEEFYEIKGGQDLLGFLDENRDIKVDILIIEGTNIGSNRLPIAPQEAMNVVKRLASSTRTVVATLHSLDLEYAYALLKIAAELDLECYVASRRIAKLLERVPNLPLTPKLVENYVDYITPSQKVTLAELEEKALILVSYRQIVDLLKDLGSVSKIAKNSVAILSEPEPQQEEASQYRVIARWFAKMGIQSYRIRTSGHYYPYQLRSIIRKVKPKEIVPIHTLFPKRLYTLSK